MNPSDDGVLDRETHLRDTIDLLRGVVAVGMFSVDMSTGEVRASPGLLEIWGLADGDESLRYDDLLQRVHPSDRLRCNEVRANALLKKQTYHTQYRVVRRDGSVRTIRGEGKFIFDDQGRPTFNQGAAVDVTSLVAAENKTLHLLEHDPLTGLLSRNAFVERLQRAVLHHRRDEVFGVLVLRSGSLYLAERYPRELNG